MQNEHLKIKSITKYDSKVKIILTNSQTYFLSIESFVNHQLVESIVLTDSQVEIILQESEKFESFNKAKQYLAMRDHSAGELKMKLKKKKFSSEAISKTIQKCKEFGFLDDEKYAYNIANKLVAKKPCGKAFLMAYLQTKLIPRDLGEQIASILFASLDINILALESLEKKWHMYKHLELEDARNKSYNYLARRGFSFGEAKDAFELVYNKKQEEPNN